MNVYEPIDVPELAALVRKLGTVYAPGVRSGYKVDECDEEHATVYWVNDGTDEEPHDEKAKEIADALSARGYEAKLVKPEDSTVAVRKVVPYVPIGSALEPQPSFKKAVSLAEKGPRSFRAALNRLLR